MVRGLLSKWKQPLAYFLTAGTPKAFLDKLEKIGLYSKALVCNQCSNNHSFLHKLEKVSIEKPYIVQNNKKVFVIYDPPHLLNDIRNNFMKNNYNYNSTEVKWQYIVDFYNKDKTMSFRMALKLKDKHKILPPFSAVRVNLAAQVLSHSWLQALIHCVT